MLMGRSSRTPKGCSTRTRPGHPGLIRRIGGGGEFRLWAPELSSGRNPDVAVVLVGTPQDARGRRAPSLVAEVASKRGEVRDYHEKREEYWLCGLREYWIVDPAARQVLVLVRRDDAWEERTFRGDEVIAGEVLPGFAGTVAGLWADLAGGDWRKLEEFRGVKRKPLGKSRRFGYVGTLPTGLAASSGVYCMILGRVRRSPVALDPARARPRRLPVAIC